MNWMLFFVWHYWYSLFFLLHCGHNRDLLWVRFVLCVDVLCCCKTWILPLGGLIKYLFYCILLYSILRRMWNLWWCLGVLLPWETLSRDSCHFTSTWCDLLNAACSPVDGGFHFVFWGEFNFNFTSVQSCFRLIEVADGTKTSWEIPLFHTTLRSVQLVEQPPH